MAETFHDEGQPCAGGRKVMLATTSYGSPSCAYVYSIARAREALHAAGIPTAYLLLHGDCHVDDARNSVVREFLASDCTEMMFIDADVGFGPEEIIAVCRHDLDIVGGVYPFRREGDNTMPVRLMDGAEESNGLLEVEGLPTGFMKINRRVLERMAEAAPKYLTKNSQETAMVFARPTPGPTKLRWGGDIDFCNRWRQMGGKLYAVPEIRLGHTAEVVFEDSLAASIRRSAGTTFDHIVPKLRANTQTEGDYEELVKFAGNSWAADVGVLAALTRIARNCRGPIIETGSGLSSIVMAAVTDQQVYTLEHLNHYAATTHYWSELAGLVNLHIGCAPLKDCWYDLDAFDLPKKFALGFCDGPPRLFGTRPRFLDEIAPRCSVVVVDDFASDPRYQRIVHEYADRRGLQVTPLGRAAMLARAEMLKAAA